MKLITKKTKKIIYIIFGIIGAASLIVGSTILGIYFANKSNVNVTVNSDVTYNRISTDQESYINKNSVSMCFESVPNYVYVLNTIRKVIENENNNTLKQLLINLENYLVSNNNDNDIEIYNILTGTGWIWDCVMNDNNNTYYFATNIHVLNLSYNIQFNDVIDGVIRLNFPITSQTTSLLNVYLTQCIAEKKLPSSISYLSDLNNQNYWYKLSNLNINNIDNSIIPLGALFNPNFTINSTDNYLMSININTNSGLSNVYYLNNNYQLVTNVNYASTTYRAEDLALLKVDINPNNLNYFENIQIINNLRKMLIVNDVTNNDYKKANYITKLNYLLTLSNNLTENRDLIEANFLFNSYSHLTNSTRITVGGYPGIVYNNKNGVTFNCDNVESLSVMKSDSKTLSRNNINFLFNGKSYYYEYNGENNYLLPNINLGSGSSGSMVINDDYQIIGIYWGIVKTETKLFGVSTPIYDLADNSSLVFRWLEYCNVKNIKNTQLFKLFTNLKTNGYFNSNQ